MYLLDMLQYVKRCKHIKSVIQKVKAMLGLNGKWIIAHSDLHSWITVDALRSNTYNLTVHQVQQLVFAFPVSEM